LRNVVPTSLQLTEYRATQQRLTTVTQLAQEIITEIESLRMRCASAECEKSPPK
jgi:hypothetical protein